MTRAAAGFEALLLVLQISEEVTYAVRQPTAHAINENHRVRCFRQMLLGPLETPEQLMNLGDLMYQVPTSPDNSILGPRPHPPCQSGSLYPLTNPRRSVHPDHVLALLSAIL